MTSLLNKTNRSSLGTKTVCFSLACLLIGISAIAYAGKGTVVKKGVTPSLAAAKAIAIAQPLAFEVNHGQTDQSVKFLARAKGYDAFLTSNESIVRINGDAVLRTTLRNANQSPKIAGEDLQPGKSNYLLGNDRSKWIVGVSHFAKVRAKDVYPGIDAVYSGNERQLEYDFVVNPGANPAQIRMAFDGARDVAVNSNGDLELRTAGGMMIAHKPLVYQTIDGQRKPVSGDFVLLASNEAGFHLGQYDASKTLVIDPTVTIGANVGGAADDEGFAIAANDTGIVLTGRTKSVNTGTPVTAASGFPVLAALQAQHSSPGGPSGSWDAFVTKFTIDPITGQALLAYSTYLGTPLDEAGTGVALDSAGNAYITGYTNSSGLITPTTLPAGAFTGTTYDAFVVELPSAGASITASTYLGGAGTTQAFSLAIDPVTQNIVIAGLTSAPGLAVAPTGAQKTYGGGPTDGFVATLAPGTLSLVASTYLGGAGYEQVNSVAVGTDGAVYVTGITSSGNATAANSLGTGGFPVGKVADGSQISLINALSVPANTQTAFVTKFNSAATLSGRTYSSIFGVGGETANGISVDPDGVAYVVGATQNPSFSTFSPQATCGLQGFAGALAVAANVGPNLGAAIQWAAPCFTNLTNPNQTQGFLLALTASAPNSSGATTVPGGLVKYLALQAATATDLLSVGCNLNLTKNGGTLNGPAMGTTFCLGKFGSWNAVATDSDEQAYVTGQSGIGVQAGDSLRVNRNGTSAALAPAPLSLVAADVNNGVAVNNTHRQEFVIGTTTGAVGGPGYLAPTAAPDSIINNGPAGTEDVSFFGIQWNDVFVTPSVITFAPIPVNSAAPAAIDVSTQNSTGAAVSCTFTLPGGPFTIKTLPSTGTYSVTLATDTPGVFTATSTFTCGGDNGTTTLTINAIVTGPLNLSPSATLNAFSVVGSGILTPYNTNPGNATITVAVTTAVGTIPFTVAQTGKSANFPACALVTLGAPTGPAVPPPGNTFTVTINSNCANTLPVGQYTENITASSVTPGLAANASIPFSLTITPGGVNQGIPNFIFGASTVPLVESFVVQNSGVPATAFNYTTTFGPNGNVTPLPVANATILSGASGTVPAGGSAVVTVQVSPAGLLASLPVGQTGGVFGFCYTVNSPTVPPTNACSLVFVGTGLGFVTPAGGILNISVPTGFVAANLTQPGQIQLTGLANTANTPISVALPTVTAASFTPALPTAAAFTLTGGNPCSTFAENNVNNPFGNASCFYTATVDSTQLVAGTTYVGKITFTGGGVSAVLTVNLAATATPTVRLVNDNLAPLAGITFTSAAGLDTTLCSNTFLFPNRTLLVATGGTIPNITESVSPANSWLGVGGGQASPGNLGTSNGTNFFIGTLSTGPGLFNTSVLNVCVSAANLHTPGTFLGSVMVNGGGVSTIIPITFVVGAGAPVAQSKVGVFRAGFLWVLDANGNTLFDGTGPGLDTVTAFGGLPGDIPVVGDWNGSGTSKIGVYRPSTGTWLLDFNGNGTYDGPLLDRSYQFGGLPGDIPVVGDWTGNGTSKIGLYRNGLWILDTNGNGTFDASDVVTPFGGIAGDVPVVGDWTGNGTSKIGVVRAGYLWILDTNGNGTFDAADAVFGFGGITGDVPVVGDWNGSGTSKVGVFRLGFFWVLDTNGDHAFTAGEQAFPFGGIPGDIPVVGKWIVP